MAVTKDSVQSLYIAYYGRPADPSGLEYWTNRANAEGLNAVVNAFGNSEEATNLYGNLTIQARVNNLYQNMFGRDADTEGLNFYVGKVLDGTYTLATLAQHILNGVNPNVPASKADGDTLAKKLAAANAFTAGLDTTAEILKYDQASEVPQGVTFLKDITSATTDAEIAAKATSAIAGLDGQGFTLTNNIDTATANVFTSTPVYTPGGDEFINSLQDEDVLTGIGENPTLNLTLGTANDGAESEITPTLNGIETINVRISAAAGANDGTATTALNLQDASGLETINVERITGNQPEFTFRELDASVADLNLSNSTNGGTVTFSHKEEVLTGTDEVLNASLTNVRNNGVTFNEDGDGVADEGFYFETVNLAANGTNDIDTLTIAANGREDVVAGNDEDTTKQVVTITAGATVGAAGSLEINTLNATGVDTLTIHANHRVDIAQDKAAALDDTDGLNTGDLEVLNIDGAANVRIDGLEGQVAAFGDDNGLTVNAGTMTGNLRVGVVGSTSADDLFALTSGSGNDEIRAFGDLGGDIVTNDGQDSVTVDGDAVGTASIDTGAGNDTVTVDDDLEAIGDDEDNGNQTFGEAVAASIVTGAGDDTVSVRDLESATDWNNGPSLLDQSDDTYYIKGASIATGEGNDSVAFHQAEEGTLVDTGAGNDTVTVALNDNPAPILDGDDGDSDEVGLDNVADELGAVVRLGTGDDTITITDSNSDDDEDHDVSTDKTIVGADALLDGGEGTDILNITALDAVTVAAIAQGTNGDGNGAEAFNAYITGIETANLTIANQVEEDGDGDDNVNETLGLTVNDGDDMDGAFVVDVQRFDSALDAINLRSEEAALETNVASETYQDGTAVAFTVDNLRADVALNLSANEVNAGAEGNYENKHIGAVNDDMVVDVNLEVNLADASGNNDSFTLTLQDGNAGYAGDEDIDVSLKMIETKSFPAGQLAATDYLVENLTVNLAAGGSHYINVNGFGDSQFDNSDANLGSFMQWRNADPMANWDQAVYNALTDAEKEAFGAGYEVDTSFTILGAAADEEIVVDDVTADVISILGASDVTVTVGELDNTVGNRGNNYTITTGTGEDRIVMLEDLVDDEDTIDGGTGERNTLVIQGSNSMGFDDGVQRENDEVWANKSNLQVLEMVTDGNDIATIVLDEEAFDTGIDTINVVAAGVGDDQTLTVILGEDFTRENFTIDANDVDLDLTTISFTNHQDDVYSTLDLSLAADGGAAFTLDDAFDRVTTDLVIDINDLAAGATVISATADTGGIVDGEVDLNVNATNGAINSITLVDSSVAVGDNGTITVTVANNWSASTLTVDASDIANDDSGEDLGAPNSVPATAAELAADYAASIATGGLTFNGSAETDAVLVVTGTANSDTITGGLLGDTINGGAGADTINGDNNTVNTVQVDTVTFAASYEQGDTIDVTIAGNTFRATVGAGGATGANVAAAFNTWVDTGAYVGGTNNITMSTTAGTIAAAQALVSLTDAAGVLTVTADTATGVAYAVAAATNNVASNAVAQQQVLTLDASTILDGGSDSLTVVFNGSLYTVSLSDIDVTPSIDIEASAGPGVGTLAAAVSDLGGSLVINHVVDSAITLTITGPADGTAFPTITQANAGAATTVDGLLLTAGTVATNAVQADPTVTSVTEAISDGGGNDTIDGGADNDTINGGVGNDTIAGGTGNDIITGGAGSDALNGNAGHDVFVFDAVSESSGLTVDIITGFEGGSVDGGDDDNLATLADNYTTGDVIDLTGLLGGLGFTAVEFVGTFADDTVADTHLVTGSANLQVVYVTGDNALYVDIDASGDINDGDMVIELVGVVGDLTQANFNPAAVSGL